MNDCFIIESGVVKPSPELLLIYPFKEMWEEDKEHALKEFGIIFFMHSANKKNPFLGLEEGERYKRIMKLVVKDEDFTFSSYFEKATEVFIELQEEGSDTYSYFMAALEAAEGLKKSLRTIDLGERNFKTGMPVYKPKDVTSALSDTQSVVTNLYNLREKIQQENFESQRNRKNREVGDYEDPS